MLYLKKLSLSLGILLCLSVTSFNHVLGNSKQDSDHDSGSYYVPSNPNEPFDSLNVFRVRYLAWAYAKNTDPDHAGWYSVWAEVNRDRDRRSGSYRGKLNEYAYREEDRFFWEAAPPMFSNAICQ